MPLDFPTSPDWPTLWSRFGGDARLLYRGSFSKVVSHCGGGVVMISAPAGGSPALLADLTRDFAARGVCAVAPELVIAQLDAGAFLADVHADKWTQWRAGIRSVCRAVVVAPDAGAQTSAAVWGDVCAALAVNVPVWILEDAR